MEQNNNSEQEEEIVVHLDAYLEDIIPGFLKNRRKDIKNMLKALECDDYEVIMILGHGMKGSGGGYGFEVITDIGRSLEQAAKNKNSEEVRKWVNKLSTYIERVKVVYD